MGHRPMYCSNSDNDDCTKFDDRVSYNLTRLFLLNCVQLKYYKN